jgi:diguanylate cyclase (GGDEF)-like protein/PAS domain S-box-containing protein
MVPTPPPMAPYVPLRLLLVEDHLQDAELIIDALQSAGYALVSKRVDSEADFIEALSDEPDIVLCDHALPQFDSVRALNIVKSSDRDIPFIIVSGQIGDEHAVEAMRNGADDYLLKDRLARLGAAVAAALERRRLRATARDTAVHLRETEERHRAFLENSPAVMFMKDTAGRYVHVNPEFTRAFGIEPSVAIGRLDEEIFPPEQAAAFRANDRLALESGGPVRAEGNAIYVDGPHAVMTVKFPLRDARGEISGIGGIATDINERKENEARYRATFDQAAAGIAHVTPDLRFIEVNQKLCDLLGYTREELLELTVLQVMHPDDHVRSTELRDELLSDSAIRQAPVVEKRYVRKTGAVVWVAVAVSIVSKASGEPDYFVAMIHDISERKIAEERFRATFEQAAVGIAHTSLDRRYVMVNRKLCEMTGYTREELLSMRTDQVVHPEDAGIPLDQQALLEGTRDTFTSQKRYVRKDGAIIWVSRTVSMVRDAAGMPLYFLRVIEDITERKRAQAGAALLQSTTLAIGQAQDMGTALRIVLQNICESTGWRFGQAWVQGAASDTLECRVCWHDGAPELEAFHRSRRELVFSERTGLAVSAFRSEQPRWLPDISTADFRRREAALAAGLKAWAGIPVLADGKPVALLEFFMQARQAHDEQLVELVAVVATQLGILFQRRAAEDSLRESDEKFRQLVSHIPEVFWISDAQQLTLSYLSPAVETMTGLTAAALQGCDWLHVVHPDDRERVALEWRRHGELGTFDVEFRIVHRDGTERWAQSRAFPVRDARGELHRIAGITEDITQRKRDQERLLHLAHYDQLTDLPNRVLFHDRLKQTLAQARRNAWTIGVVFVDVDRFKIINDTLGHAGGDALLQNISERLTAWVRPGDTVGRLGGDEFAVILSELATPQDAGLVAAQILKALAAPFHIDGHATYTTASIGISLYPSDSDDIDTLIGNADMAMYGAKAAGGDCYRFYTAEMNERAREKTQLERKLRHALEREEFLLHFQPKADIVTGEISGCEALLRWQSPEDGLVPPDRFIPLLEETGMIVPVGEWVLRAACAQVKAWQESRVRPVPIAINLSARQFQQQDLCELISKTLRDHGVAARFLELEITESAAIQNAEASIAALRELKALGVAIAIDDFGTGYSSLSYLKRLPVDTVKIDRAFITDLATNPEDASIAQAIINMAHNLSLKVVAEGVETASQLSFLGSHGCDQMQGYYFSRPVPAAAMTELLTEGRRMQRPSGDADDGEHTLLLLDDEDNVLSALKRLLRQDNYRIFTATNAKAGFEILANHKVGVILSDQRMPDVTGVEFLRRVKALYPGSVRLVLSGYTDLASVTDAINKGSIYRFLTKPWDDSLLRAHIAEAFRRYSMLHAQEREQQQTRAKVEELSRANRRLHELLEEARVPYACEAARAGGGEERSP